MAGFHTKTFLKHDDYMTPKYAWENIKQYIPKDKVIWEPFMGDGKSGEYLTELGFNVIHNHNDFFENNEGDVIVSNPPFSNKNKMMTRMKELDKPFILVAPSVLLCYKYFQDYFKDKLQIIVPYDRIKFRHLNSINKNYSPPYASFFFCYKMNLDKDLIFI